MTDEQTTQEIDPDSLDDSNDSFKQLRDAYKALAKDKKSLEKELETARPQLRSAALEKAGFDPESKQAAALMRLHEGDLDPEALKATAEEYGLAPDNSGGESEGEPDGQPNGEEPVLSESEKRAQQLRARSEPAGAPQSRDQQITDAETRGDWETVDRLNAEKLQAVRQAS